MSCGIGHRRGSDLALLWLWRRPGAIARIRPLAWEPPYAVSTALKRQKKKKVHREVFPLLFSGRECVEFMLLLIFQIFLSFPFCLKNDHVVILSWSITDTFS